MLITLISVNRTEGKHTFNIGKKYNREKIINTGKLTGSIEETSNFLLVEVKDIVYTFKKPHKTKKKS